MIQMTLDSRTFRFQVSDAERLTEQAPLRLQVTASPQTNDTSDQDWNISVFWLGSVQQHDTWGKWLSFILKTLTKQSKSFQDLSFATYWWVCPTKEIVHHALQRTKKYCHRASCEAHQQSLSNVWMAMWPYIYFVPQFDLILVGTVRRWNQNNITWYSMKKMGKPKHSGSHTWGSITLFILVIMTSNYILLCLRLSPFQQPVLVARTRNKM